MVVLVVAFIAKLGVDYYSRDAVRKEAKFAREIKEKGSGQGLLGGASYGGDDHVRADSSALDVIVPQQQSGVT